MTFFVTSAGPGKGADLGGLDGADAHCQQLAQAGGRRAARPGAPISARRRGGDAVNAATASATGRGRTPRATRSRQDVDELHSANNKLSKQTALNEKGEAVNGRGDTPNRHDILTGSQPDGTAFAAGEDRTCGNWTKSGAGAAMVGHHDRTGLNDGAALRCRHRRRCAGLARPARRRRGTGPSEGAGASPKRLRWSPKSWLNQSVRAR